MGLPLPHTAAAPGDPFDLADPVSYRRWRDWKLRYRPADAASITVEVGDPRALSAAERSALLTVIRRTNMALYRSPVVTEDRDLPRLLGAQLGLRRLDANWLADEDGISSIAVHSGETGGAAEDRAGFIPYTNRAIGWHTDGYYHPEQRRIHGMILHCVRPAASGGTNRLLDPDLLYIALRDDSPALIAALMRPDAMTIPGRRDASGEARPAQPGPVFAVEGVALHLRYTARTRSIAWHDDATVQRAAARLAALLEAGLPGQLQVRLQPGMGLVGHNVLHDRSAFVDDPARPRLLYRARFLDRVAMTED